MTGQREIKDYFSLTLKMSLILSILGHALVFAHELGHGLTALVLGGYFPFLQIDAEGGRSIFFFPLESPQWKEAIVLLAGPVVSFLISVLTLGLIFSGIKNREIRLWSIYAGGISCLFLITGTGLMPPWWPKYKEIGEALSLLGLSPAYQIFLKLLWTAILIVLTLAFFKLFFTELSEYFPTNTYKRRFLLVTLVLAVPVMAIMTALSIVMLKSGYGEGVITTSRHMPHIIFLVLTYLLLPFFIASFDNQTEKKRFAFGRKQLATYLILVVTWAISQPLVFGNSRTNPSGLFIGKPPEVQVSSCNISLTIDQHYRAKVRILMRPFVFEHKFLWDRVKNSEPEDWKYYKLFVERNLPSMLGTQTYNLTDSYNDVEVPFFNKTWDKGARVIEAEVDLLQSLYFKSQAANHVLQIVDFWREQQIGNIDYTEVKLDSSFQITDVVVEPQNASRPRIDSKNQARWENNHFENSFARSFIFFR